MRLIDPRAACGLVPMQPEQVAYSLALSLSSVVPFTGDSRSGSRRDQACARVRAEVCLTGFAAYPDSEGPCALVLEVPVGIPLYLCRIAMSRALGPLDQ